MFEKKKLNKELKSIDKILNNNENWDNYSETNSIFKKIIFKVF